jgi:hypothetical protein
MEKVSTAVEYFILAGPQAAGKSTLGKYICSTDSSVISLQESRQLVIHNSTKKGAIFMTDLDELEVIHYDMTRMFTILGQDRLDRCYLDETNVFTLGHARAHGIDLLEGYFRQYCDLLRKFKTGLIFIDIPPSVSWERRRHRYAQRLWDFSDEAKEQTMVRYKTYLDRLYPELLSIYDRLDFPKIKIDGTLSPDNTAREASEAVLALRRTGI